jgi:hypothetical protein
MASITSLVPEFDARSISLTIADDDAGCPTDPEQQQPQNSSETPVTSASGSGGCSSA